MANAIQLPQLLPPKNIGSANVTFTIEGDTITQSTITIQTVEGPSTIVIQLQADGANHLSQDVWHKMGQDPQLLQDMHNPQLILSSVTIDQQEAGNHLPFELISGQVQEEWALNWANHLIGAELKLSLPGEAMVMNHFIDGVIIIGTLPENHPYIEG